MSCVHVKIGYVISGECSLFLTVRLWYLTLEVV